MKTIKFKYLLPCALLGMMLGVASCVNDLNTVPLDKDELVSDVVFGNEPLAYEQSLAKIYAGMAIGGNSGGDSDQDVVGIDGGSQASFLRVLWNMQDLPSDIAHCAWNDPGIPEFNHISWGASSPWIKGSYYRLFYQINVANAYLRETTEDKLDARGCDASLKASIKTWRAEARFLRALSYEYALDLYRNVPFVDENSPIGSIPPKQIMAADLFTDGDGYVDKDGRKLTINWLTYPNRLEQPLLAIYAQETLKNIGIDVQINNTPDHMTYAENGEFDLYISSATTAPTGDPEYFFTSTVAGAKNYGNYQNEEVSGLVETLHKTFDQEERGELAVELQQKILDDASFFFVAHLNMGIVTKANVTGINPHPCDYYEITAELNIE